MGVDRNTVCQRKAHDGLDLLLVTDQYHAISGNIMIWSLGPGSHPLRIILHSHLQDLLRRKWGVSDLPWVVSRGGNAESMGSP